MSNDIALWSTTRQAEAIRRREISSRGLLEHTIMRIERINPTLKAVVTTDFVARARAADLADSALGARRCGRAAARRADHHQRRAGDARHPIHRRRHRTAQQRSDARRAGGARGESRRRDRHRQNQSAALVGRRADVQRDVRHYGQSVECRARSRRLVRRRRCGGCRRPHVVRNRHRHRRIDPHPGGVQRHLRPQTELGHRAEHRLSRSSRRRHHGSRHQRARAAGAIRGRSGTAARRSCCAKIGR